MREAYPLSVVWPCDGPGGMTEMTERDRSEEALHGVALAAGVNLEAKGLERVGKMWKETMARVELVAGLDLGEEEPAFSVRLAGGEDDG